MSNFSCLKITYYFPFKHFFRKMLYSSKTEINKNKTQILSTRSRLFSNCLP